MEIPKNIFYLVGLLLNPKECSLSHILHLGSSFRLVRSPSTGSGAQVTNQSTELRSSLLDIELGLARQVYPWPKPDQAWEVCIFYDNVKDLYLAYPITQLPKSISVFFFLGWIRLFLQTQRDLLSRSKKSTSSKIAYILKSSTTKHLGHTHTHTQKKKKAFSPQTKQKTQLKS